MTRQEDCFLTALQKNEISPDSFLDILDSLVDWNKELNASQPVQRKYSQLASFISDYWKLREYFADKH